MSKITIEELSTDLVNALSTKQQMSYISPQMFGLDNSVKNIDIYDSLQKCLNYCKENDGGIIHIPYGQYTLSKMLNIFKNTKLVIADGATITAQAGCPTMLINANAGEMFENYNGNGNINIEGGIWISNSPGVAESSRNIFGIARGRKIIIKNITFKNVKSSHAIDLNACTDVLIDNCRFEGFKNNDAGDREYSEAIQISEHTEAGFNTFGKFDGHPNSNIIVQNCYFGASDFYEAWGTGIGNHASVNDVFQDNIKILNNTFDGLKFTGVRIFKWVDTIVSGNTFKNCARGVSLSNVLAGTESSKNPDGTQSNKSQSGSRAKIINNEFINCSLSGIYASGQYSSLEDYAPFKFLTISNNTFMGTNVKDSFSYSVLDLRHIYNVVISNNIFDTVKRALFIKTSCNVKIDNNIIQNSENEAIYMEAENEIFNATHMRKITISNNTIENCGRTGIFAQIAEEVAILNNSVNKVSTSQSNARDAIMVATGVNHGIVSGNTMRNENLTNRYGINITATCKNILLGENNVFGLTNNILASNNALTNIDGAKKWVNINLQPGVTNHNQHMPAMVMRDANGICYLKGALTHSKKTGHVKFKLATLPNGFIPSQSQAFATIASIQGNAETSFNRIFINNNGDIILESTTSTSDIPYTVLDGISFSLI